jgi:hypothetical protein
MMCATLGGTNEEESHRGWGIGWPGEDEQVLHHGRLTEGGMCPMYWGHIGGRWNMYRGRYNGMERGDYGELQQWRHMGTCIMCSTCICGRGNMCCCVLSMAV